MFSATSPLVGLDESDVHGFTEGVLKFWRENGRKMKAWSDAARIIFSIPPNSAASERVFALLQDMFASGQIMCLADYTFRLHSCCSTTSGMLVDWTDSSTPQLRDAPPFLPTVG